MSTPRKDSSTLPLRPVTLGVLFVAATLLGYASGFPNGAGFVLTVAVVIFAAGLRTVGRRGASVCVVRRRSTSRHARPRTHDCPCRR